MLRAGAHIRWSRQKGPEQKQNASVCIGDSADSGKSFSLCRNGTPGGYERQFVILETKTALQTGTILQLSVILSVFFWACFFFSSCLLAVSLRAKQGTPGRLGSITQIRLFEAVLVFCDVRNELPRIFGRWNRLMWPIRCSARANGPLVDHTQKEDSMHMLDPE